MVLLQVGRIVSMGKQMIGNTSLVTMLTMKTGGTNLSNSKLMVQRVGQFKLKLGLVGR